MYIVKVLLRQKYLFQLTPSAKSLQTPKLCCLISIDHKGLVSLLITSLGVTGCFMKVAVHTLLQKPHKY